MTSKDFKAIRLRLSENSGVYHYLYIKQNVVREACKEKPSDKTLFVMGIPPYFTENCISHLFQQCGAISNVYIHDKPSFELPKVPVSKFFERKRLLGFKVAYVVFESTDSLKKALKLKKHLTLQTEDYKPLVGVQKWCQEYNDRIPNIVELQYEVDAFITDFDEKCREERLRQKQLMEADGEGWVTVTRKGRNPGFARKQTVKEKILEKQKKKNKKLLNFYAFEIKESKMNHLELLRKKFEEDKQKIEALKKARKFRPFV
ncbi:unnamed protein product [Bemisia tabaci]|uniref:Ribosomal RNA-processing protein 7 C-terminal domain-containing protein n=1 Tax=Bemisia tabaci TaxID=7038 RepID=A0A9P0EY28_BEMTA|nr:unnamed protein product [Bemisia tabaci]